jgi:hypothetical protein
MLLGARPVSERSVARARQLQQGVHAALPARSPTSHRCAHQSVSATEISPRSRRGILVGFF